MLTKANPQWFDAMAVAGDLFSKTGQDYGWPRSMSPRQIAALQRPEGNAMAMQKAIESACEHGALLHRTRPDRPLQGIKPKYFGDTAPCKYWVKAEDFSAWLAGCKMQPSMHITAWIEATVTEISTVQSPTGTTLLEEISVGAQPPVSEKNWVDKGNVYKKKVLVERLLPNWPNIVNHFQHGKKNGLLSHARVPKNQGEYFENAAIEWAKKNGYWNERETLPNAQNLMANLTGIIHSKG